MTSNIGNLLLNKKWWKMAKTRYLNQWICRQLRASMTWILFWEIQTIASCRKDLANRSRQEYHPIWTSEKHHKEKVPSMGIQIWASKLRQESRRNLLYSSTGTRVSILFIIYSQNRRVFIYLISRDKASSKRRLIHRRSCRLASLLFRLLQVKYSLWVVWSRTSSWRVYLELMKTCNMMKWW